jgi:hypothetical protein
MIFVSCMICVVFFVFLFFAQVSLYVAFISRFLLHDSFDAFSPTCPCCWVWHGIYMDYLCVSIVFSSLVFRLLCDLLQLPLLCLITYLFAS